jgi:sec-independent protein translocase protein TatA
VGIGWTEILVVVGVVLLLFGGKKIPEMMRGLGSGVREFKKGMNGEDDEPKREVKSDPNNKPVN